MTNYNSLPPCASFSLCRCVGEGVRYVAYCRAVVKDLDFVLGSPCPRPDPEICFPCVVTSFQQEQLRNDIRYDPCLSRGLKGWMLYTYGLPGIDDNAGRNGAHNICIVGFVYVLLSYIMSSFFSAPLRCLHRRAYLLFGLSSTLPRRV